MIGMLNLGRWGRGKAIMDFVSILFWHLSTKADDENCETV
jgi:hypothetical protein